MMMVVMPWIAQAMGLSQAVAGAWFGGNIDTTAAVVGAGTMFGPDAQAVAAVVKSGTITLELALSGVPLVATYVAEPRQYAHYQAAGAPRFNVPENQRLLDVPAAGYTDFAWTSSPEVDLLSPSQTGLLFLHRKAPIGREELSQLLDSFPDIDPADFTQMSAERLKRALRL